MDSLSQFTLGAAVGEAVLGKKIGNKAILWGGIAGTIPDLDVIFMPLIEDPVIEIGFHRGLSHAFFFHFFLAILMAWLLFKWFKNKDAMTTYKDWFLLFFLGFTTHAILDSFTTWGTQLWLPFSDDRVAINNIFVADPLYTIPFFGFLVATMFVHRSKPLRRKLNYAGITISCLYLAFTFYNKITVNNIVKENLQAKGIKYNKLMTAPTPLQNFLWYTVIDTDEGCYMGVYSILQDDRNIEFEFFERKKELLGDLLNTRAVQRIIWFAKGYYMVRRNEDGELLVIDLKFGKMDFDIKNGEFEDRFIFPFKIIENEEEVTFEQIDQRPDGDEAKASIKRLMKRAFLLVNSDDHTDSKADQYQSDHPVNDL